MESHLCLRFEPLQKTLNVNPICSSAGWQRQARTRLHSDKDNLYAKQFSFPNPKYAYRQRHIATQKPADDKNSN